MRTRPSRTRFLGTAAALRSKLILICVVSVFPPGLCCRVVAAGARCRRSLPGGGCELGEKSEHAVGEIQPLAFCLKLCQCTWCLESMAGHHNMAEVACQAGPRFELERCEGVLVIGAVCFFRCLFFRGSLNIAGA